ncbi:hypothetical protein JJB07_01295 [Tumebacillus sp. ITR2]|uniref:Holin-like toxin n=1 Tax=Tumebacillus amylolyticus TaxID=2801339 RepID=A0ABS1J4V4_9BACL|nr:hypothetical protein [Tumebacillus amylolyticus]
MRETQLNRLLKGDRLIPTKGGESMSNHDELSLMLQFGLLLIAFLSLIVTIMKHWIDMQNEKKK